MFTFIKNIVRKIVYFLPSSYILMFHHITNSPKEVKSGCLLSWEKFTDIMDSNTKKFASIYDVIRKPNKKKIAITFDDGLADLYEKAYPFLKKRNIPFTVFIVTDFLDKPGYLTTSQLQELAKDSLVTIGSHGTTHIIFPKLSIEEKEVELRESKKILEELIQKEISVFAYSHGQYDKETLKFVSKYYDYAVSVIQLPLNFLTKRKKLLPRINFENDTYLKNKKILNKN